MTKQEQMRELVFGHLDAGTPARKKDLRQLQDFLSRAIIPQDIAAFKGSSFSFENSDFLSAERIPQENAALLRLFEKEKAPEELEFRVRCAASRLISSRDQAR